MDPAWSVELRYSGISKVRDIFLAVLLGIVPGMLALIPLRQVVAELTLLHVVGVWAAVALPALFCLGAVHWGGRARIDSRGIAVQAGFRGPAEELAWAEVEWIHFRARGGFEVRGRERRIVIPWTFEGAAEARGWVVERARPTIEERLREALRTGSIVVFPGPLSRPAGFAALAAVLLFLASPVALLGRLYGRIEGCATLGLIVVGVMGLAGVWTLLGQFARLEAGPEGLRIVRLSKGKIYPWDRIRGIQLRPEGGAALVFGWRESLELPPSLANLWALPRLLADRRGPAA